jgi:Ca2+/Na+ antiporter
MFDRIPDRYFPILLILLFIVFVVIGLSTSDFLFQVGLFALFGFIVQWWMKRRGKEKNSQTNA